ncbi:hypothetical protein TorRG33x02_339400 [Trema orientale]|uniref:Uncharacterized protein n=1 Tax=Trema orientale TaxID=63057 RepID=A0A2P5AWG7_TREOI|nr:hypothetical protein TorRG33x02_339400 [Trema orientale]
MFDWGRSYRSKISTGVRPPLLSNNSTWVEATDQKFRPAFDYDRKLRPQSNIAGRLLGPASVTFDFFDLVENFRLGSSQR